MTANNSSATRGSRFSGTRAPPAGWEFSGAFGGTSGSIQSVITVSARESVEDWGCGWVANRLTVLVLSSLAGDLQAPRIGFGKFQQLDRLRSTLHAALGVRVQTSERRGLQLIAEEKAHESTMSDDEHHTITPQEVLMKGNAFDSIGGQLKHGDLASEPGDRGLVKMMVSTTGREQVPSTPSLGRASNTSPWTETRWPKLCDNAYFSAGPGASHFCT